MKYVVIGLSDPDAVGAGPRHALPGLWVYTLKSICPRQMVSFCPLGGRDGFAFGEPPTPSLSMDR